MKELLPKYIAGETDDNETKQVEEWLMADPAHFKEFELLWDLWYEVGTAANVFRFNVDEGWEALLQKRRAGQPAYKEPGRSKKRFYRKLLFIGAAAAAAMIILVSLWIWQKNYGTGRVSGIEKEVSEAGSKKMILRDSSSTLVAVTEATKPGRSRKITLPDGSVAWLNGNTKISYTEAKNGNARSLYLEGEAFFNIKHNSRKPFIVRTRHAAVKVLGTRFDVVAYPDDPVTEAVLTGGSILFTAESKKERVSRHIEPGQKVSINFLSGQLKVINVDTAFYASWREGKLLFRDETFARVAKAMGHKYGVAFEFKNKALLNKRLNGYLEKESLQEALEALKLTLQFHYRIKDGEVIIY